MGKMTRINPDGVTYRVPVELAGRFTLSSAEYNGAFLGDIVDRLGKYEAIGLEPEELKRMIPPKKQ